MLKNVFGPDTEFVSGGSFGLRSIGPLELVGAPELNPSGRGGAMTEIDCDGDTLGK